MSRRLLLASLSIIVMLLAGCANPVPPNPPGNNTTAPPGNNTTGVPTPASLFCAEHNGTLEIRTATGGGQFGVCSFPGGAKCEEWAFYRGECSAGKPNFCEADSDCGCGVHVGTRDCFYGQREFVDEAQQCPDFCNGIAAHLEIKCMKNQCTQVQKDMCVNFQPDECPSGCAVCPPCAECSSIRCQKETACEALGFGKDWYNSTVNPK